MSPNDTTRFGALSQHHRLKELRKYDLITEIANQGGAERLRELAAIDFTAAVETWEYKLAKDINAFGGTDVFGMLESISESKLRAAVLTSSGLSNLVYGAARRLAWGRIYRLFPRWWLLQKLRRRKKY